MEVRLDMTRSYPLPSEFVTKNCTQDTFRSFDQSSPVPSVYVSTESAGWKMISRGDEIMDQEILRAVEQSGSFGFLADPQENVYTPEDVEPA